MKKLLIGMSCLLILAFVSFGCEDNQDGYSCRELKNRIEAHRAMALAYYSAYDAKAVKDGEAYENWTFSDDAVYWSPYFTVGEIIELGPVAEQVAGSIANSATMEAKAFSVNFPDWAPVEFKCWPSDNGFVMRTKFEGTHKDTGEKMSFYTHGFVETNEALEIIRWETWPDPNFDDFLETAIGVRGPWHDSGEYFAEITKFLIANGLM